MKSKSRICLLLLVAGLASCNAKRDEALRRLYLDGIDYFKDTKIALDNTHNALEAAQAIENSLPRLEKLVERKKTLEKQYPEIEDRDQREKIHGKFPEFHNLRKEFQEFMANGQQLLVKYRGDERFSAAVRRGMALTNYF